MNPQPLISVIEFLRKTLLSESQELPYTLPDDFEIPDPSIPAVITDPDFIGPLPPNDQSSGQGTGQGVGQGNYQPDNPYGNWNGENNAAQTSSRTNDDLDNLLGFI